MTDVALIRFLHRLADLYDEGDEPGTSDAAACLRTVRTVAMPAVTHPPFPAMSSLNDATAHGLMADLAPVLHALPWYAPGAEDGRIPHAINSGLRTCLLFGPDAPVPCETAMGGLFAQDRGVPYGTRVHEAVELFITIAGRADWTLNGVTERDVGAGGRVFHPSMAPHASATPESAVIAAWVWSGALDFGTYAYVD